MSGTVAPAPSRLTAPPGQRSGAIWPFLGLVERDFRVMRRDFLTVIARSAVQPLLFVVVFGYILPAIGSVREGFQSILIPGILSMSIVLSGMQAVTLPIAIDLGFVREIDDRLLCPLRIEWIGVEKILWGAVQATVSAAVVFPIALAVMGTDTVTMAGWDFALLAVMVAVTSIMAAALGLVLGTLVRPQQIALLFSVIVTPMIFFGATYYPWEALSKFPVLKWILLVNPLVYASEGMRAIMTENIPSMPGWGIATGTTISTVVFGWLGIKRFKLRALE